MLKPSAFAIGLLKAQCAAFGVSSHASSRGFIGVQNLCFTKKIRYESRKQLAQARPRIKGQVRTCTFLFCRDP